MRAHALAHLAARYEVRRARGRLGQREHLGTRHALTAISHDRLEPAVGGRELLPPKASLWKRRMLGGGI